MAKKYNVEINGIKYFKKSKVIGHGINNEPIIKTFYGKGEKDADRQIEEYEDRIKKGLVVNRDNLTIAQFMEKWLFDVLHNSKNIKSASFDKHETNYRLYIKNSKLGCFQLNNVNSKMIQEYYNKLFNEQGKTSCKIFDLNKTLRKFFTYCISEHLILDNPCSLSKIEIPGNADGDEDDTEIEENQITVFDDDDLKQLQNNIIYKEGENNTFNISIQLCLMTGLRKGELLGLKRKFVDLDKCTIKVRNTLKLVKEFKSKDEHTRTLKLIRPKTKTSIRDVPFPNTLKPVLKKYFVEQEKKYKNLGLKFDGESLIFTTETCNPIDLNNHNKQWERFLSNNEIEYKKFHSLRDTYATTLIRRGAKIFEVKELLGHSTIKTTERYYIFCFPEDKSKTVNLISDLVTY